MRNVKPKHSAPRRIQPLRGWNSVNPSSAKPQTAVANAPLVWGYGRLCLSEALTLNQRIIFNRTARNNSTCTVEFYFGVNVRVLTLSEKSRDDKSGIA